MVRHFSVAFPEELVNEIDRIKEIASSHSDGRITRNFLLRRWAEDGARRWRAEHEKLRR